ncbi:hypothetical protein HanIR_Chr15g0771541 [Helianthus annuus]|nr:hypothetical protein HanIR_Chr15g0771541 [Helianthus annuus]
MTAAANDTPDIELKLGRCESTKWTEAKIMIQYVSFMSLQLSLQTRSWNFCKDFPPVTIYTMLVPTSTTSCCGTTM